MKQFLRKFIIYVVMTTIALPAGLLVNLATASHAKAGGLVLPPIFTEVYVSGSNDWVEVYNPNAADSVDLLGYKLKFEASSAETFVINEDVIISPKGLTVITEDQFSPGLDLYSTSSISEREISFLSPSDQNLGQDVAYGGFWGLQPSSGKSLQYRISDQKWFVGSQNAGTYDIDFPSVSVTKSPDQSIANTGYTVNMAFTNSVIDLYQVTKDGVDGAWTAYAAPLHFSADGQYIVVGHSQDSIGNYAEEQVSFTIDQIVLSLATISIASDNANPEYAKVGDTVTVDLVANEPIETPDVLIAGRAAIVTKTSDTTYSASVNMEATDTEGLVAFSIDYDDLAGNPGTTVESTSDESSVTFDKTKPMSPVFDPFTTPVNAASELVTGTAELNSTVVLTDGVSVYTGATDLTGKFSVLVNLTQDGINAFDATAIDAAGNISEPVNIKIVEDSQSPEITVTKNPAGDPTQSATVTVVYSEDSTVRQYKLDGGEWQEYLEPVVVSTEGSHSFVAKGIDAALNESTSGEVSFMIDTTVTEPAMTVSVVQKDINISWTEKDTDIDHYDVYVGSTFETSALYASTKNLSIVYPGNAYGKYAIRVIAIDSLGNQSAGTVGKSMIWAEIKAPFVAAAATPVVNETPQQPPVAGPQVAPTPAQASSDQSSSQQEISSSSSSSADDQGEIKGEQDKGEKEPVNWTPWIILFILILLAGAATGGYFYWFAKDEDEAEKENRIDKNIGKKATVVVRDKKKAKRW